MNEFELIERFFARPPRSTSVALGVGDDAALLMPSAGCELAVSVDMLVEGRHFFAGADPERLGHKALAVNLSDMAAMGATPRWALLAGALPDNDAAWLGTFARGFFALADAHGVDLVGGDTTRGPRNLCVTILGEVPVGRALRRDGARPGDDIYVSGALGDAALAVAVQGGRSSLAADALAAARRRLEMPQPRNALGIALRGVATAAIDVSDGLTGDLGHILARSEVGAVVDLGALPHSAALAAKLAGAERALGLDCLLAGGDDYELLFTAAPAAAMRIEEIAKELALPLTRIGAITETRDLVVKDERGSALATLPRAYDHFAVADR
ncbi:MAG: thiamine-phosphate kinase [Casimicrobiaceae bacterium]